MSDKCVKYKLLIIISFCIGFCLFTGCKDDKRIDKASLVETVTAEIKDNKTVYTFYLLSGDDEPKGIEIKADGFEDAYKLAKEKYCPDISLAKFELFVMEDKLQQICLKKDVEYMSGQYSISPQVYVALSDSETMDNISKSKDVPKKIEDFIVLMRKNKGYISANSLTIFNKFNSDTSKDFYISYITFDSELKSSVLQLMN